MTSMHKLGIDTVQDYMMRSIPYIVWTMLFSLGYTIATYVTGGNALEIGDYEFLTCYMKGWMVGIPLVILGVAQKKVHNFWEFIVIGIGLSVALYFLSHSLLLIVETIVIWLLYFNKRLNKTDSFLDEVHPALLLLYFGYFIFTAFQNLLLLQKLTVTYFVISSMLIFSYYGINRFVYYIQLRKEKTNMPVERLMRTGIRIYGIATLVICLVVLPLIYTQYELVNISWVELEYTEEELETEEVEETTQEDTMSMFADLANDTEENYLMKYIWWVTEKVTVVTVTGIMIYFLVKMIREMLRNFREMQIDSYDVIESTIIEDQVERRKKRRRRLEERFDYSEGMRIRRRYKRELKKYHPKPWQSPSEMEEMAKVEIPELHEQYERVRYRNQK